MPHYKNTASEKKRRSTQHSSGGSTQHTDHNKLYGNAATKVYGGPAHVSKQSKEDMGPAASHSKDSSQQKKKKY